MKRVLWLSGVLAMVVVLCAVAIAKARRDSGSTIDTADPPLVEHVEAEKPAQPVVAAPARTLASRAISGRPANWSDFPPETTLVGGDDLSTVTRSAADRPPSSDPFRLASAAGIGPPAMPNPANLARGEGVTDGANPSLPAGNNAAADDYSPRKAVVQAVAEIPAAGGSEPSESQQAPLLEPSAAAGASPAIGPGAGKASSSGGTAVWDTGDVGRGAIADDPQPPPRTSPKLAPLGTDKTAPQSSSAEQGRRESHSGSPRSIPQPAEVFDDAEPQRLRADPRAIPAVASVGGTAGWPPQQPPAVEGKPIDVPAPGLSQGSAGDDTFGEGTGRPGPKQLEGPQTPQLTIHKTAPPEVQVGKPATFRITVRNTGNVPASGVEIHDQIPKGARVVGTNPPAQRGVHGELVFSVGTLKPGDEVAVEVQLMPLVEGEIGSIATVTFNADASGRTVATKPQLVLETIAPQSVLIGEEVTIGIVLSNPGTGVATNVVLYEQVPEGMYHPAGAELEYAVGQLRPGEQRKLELTLVAKHPGAVTNVLIAKADGNLQAEDRRTIHITAPKLEVIVEGPKKRYLEREGTYQISIANPGTAPAQQVELMAVLPSGLKFVGANNNGHYDEANRTVHWRLEELPTGEKGTVELVTVPVEAGQQSVRLVATAQRGVRVEREHPVTIEGIAAVMFQVADTVDPVEVGGETTYEIRVVNQGSKAATNLRLAVLLPPELKPVAADGPTRNSLNGNHVIFDGLPRLAAKADTTYRVRVQGVAPGDLRTRIQLMTDEMASPVTKEESTRVFAEE